MTAEKSEKVDPFPIHEVAIDLRGNNCSCCKKPFGTTHQYERTYTGMSGWWWNCHNCHSTQFRPDARYIHRQKQLRRIK